MIRKPARQAHGAEYGFQLTRTTRDLARLGPPWGEAVESLRERTHPGGKAVRNDLHFIQAQQPGRIAAWR